jgi:uncharacterized protein YaiL (DUF2058 family)
VLDHASTPPAQSPGADDDDWYARFPVPDDLTW